MKWLLVVVVGLVAIVLGVAGIGAALPRNHKASRTLKLNGQPADIWPVVMQALTTSSVPVDVVENQPPHRLVTRVKETEKMFGGTWTVTITPIAGANATASSAVSITEDGWVANPIFRFMSRFVIGHHATMDGMLKQVAKTLNQEPVLSGE